MSWEQRMADRAAERAVVDEARAVMDEEQERRERDAARESRREEVRATIPPPLRDGVCGHGTEWGRGGLAPFFEIGCAWAGGIGFCECCRSDFGYIGLALIGGGEYSRTPNEHLCYGCGAVDEVTQRGVISFEVAPS